MKKADFIITTDNERKVLDTLTNEIRRLYYLTNDEMKKLNDRIDRLNKDLSSFESSNKADMNVLRDDIKKNDTEVSEVILWDNAYVANRTALCSILQPITERSFETIALLPSTIAIISDCVTKFFPRYHHKQPVLIVWVKSSLHCYAENRTNSESINGRKLNRCTHVYHIIIVLRCICNYNNRSASAVIATKMHQSLFNEKIDFGLHCIADILTQFL